VIRTGNEGRGKRKEGRERGRRRRRKEVRRVKNAFNRKFFREDIYISR
jgi:hypothetical protein